MVFGFHGHPSLVHRLTYRRANRNCHVHGDKEEGTITTAFDMRVQNDLDRFHLLHKVRERVPDLGSPGAHLSKAATARRWRPREHPAPALSHPPRRNRLVDHRPAHQSLGSAADPAWRGIGTRVRGALRRHQLCPGIDEPAAARAPDRELTGLGAQAQIDADLAEWDYGDYDGLRTAEIKLQYPGWDIWEDGCPGGDMPHDTAVRADRLIDRLIDRLHGLGGTTALFSHGQFGRVLAARWIGLRVAQGQHFALDPASVSILGFEADHPHRRVIARWNAGA